MRYVVRYDNKHGKWLVIDRLPVDQAVGCHRHKPQALIQAEIKELLWHQFGLEANVAAPSLMGLQASLFGGRNGSL